MRGFHRCCYLVISLLAGLTPALPVVADGQGLYLYLIEGVNRVGAVDIDTRAPLTVTLHAGAAAELSAQLQDTSAQVLRLQGGSLQVTLPPDTVNLSPPVAADLEPTWVIDFDEPSVAALTAQLNVALGEHPPIAALVEFVSAFITDKNYANSFDLASQVASSAAGDCTEHAVLTTALARAQGYPSRVVFGAAVLIRAGGELEVAGHAWSEIHDGERWLLADASLLGADKQAAVYYVPWGVLRQEGPNFSMAVVEVMLRRPHKVVVDAL